MIFVAEERHGWFDERTDTLIGIYDNLETAKAHCQRFEAQDIPSKALEWVNNTDLIERPVWRAEGEEEREYAIFTVQLNDYHCGSFAETIK